MKTLLLVSQDQTELEKMCRQLSGRFQVDTADSLLKYAERVTEKAYDFVFLDVNLVQKMQDSTRDLVDGGPLFLELDELSGRIPTLAEVRKNVVERVEKTYLEAVLAQHAGRINKTSETSGVSSRQLHKLMTKYGIHKELYKRL